MSKVINWIKKFWKNILDFVFGKDKIELLKEKWELWEECFNIKNEHSLTYQLILLSYEINKYRIINEARRYNERTSNGGFKLNGNLHNLLDDAFYHYILMKFRKLVDTYPFDSEDGKRDVISIISLLNDLIANVDLLSRKNLILIYEQKKDPRELLLHYEINFTIDKLCKVSNDKRSPDDIVSVEIFKDLKKYTNKRLNKIVTYVNKRIAHASKSILFNVNANKNYPSIKELVDTLSYLINVNEFLYNLLFNKGEYLTYYPQVNEDLLEYLDVPLIPTEKKEKLRSKIEEVEKEFEEMMIKFHSELRTKNIDEVIIDIFKK